MRLPPESLPIRQRQIDEIVAPEQVRRRIKMDAGVEDMDIVDILENASQEES